MDKDLKKLASAYQQVQEAMDPVNKAELKGKHKDRKDKDIDNDGDVDGSDEYLHKRRKAVSKAVKEEDEKMPSKEEVMKCCKAGMSKEDCCKKFPGCDHTKLKEMYEACMREMKTNEELTKTQQRALQNVKAQPKSKVSLKKEPWKKDKEGDVSTNAKLDKDAPSEQKESRIRTALKAVLEADRSKKYKGATDPETMDDKLKGKGAKDMLNQPVEKDDTEEKGHKDASDAGRTTKPAKARNGGDAVRSGDQKVVNAIAAAYKSMK